MLLVAAAACCVTPACCSQCPVPSACLHLTELLSHPPGRHEAQQGDGLAKYGWLQHDGHSYGVQQLWDGQYNITTAWVGACACLPTCCLPASFACQACLLPMCESVSE